MNIERHDFTSGTELAQALSAAIAGKLAAAIAERGQATLAVSGGTTPVRLFEVLSRQMIDWTAVTITLVDERFVPTTSERSNEKLVREHLLREHAGVARFVGLYNPTATVETAALAAASRIDALRRPFDVVVLGMGNDGHTASFFPGADRLDQAIDPTTRAIVLPIHAEGAGEKRLTLTLPLIVEANMLVLHIEGAAKLEVFEKALAGADEYEMPVRAVLNKARTPVEVYWSS
ncbi:6-phosphogluconolactonase [Falsochrobactrum shanghaiense]|uniref:6-phosphogluconolactonase n=1 Tax=Falsochrobactrum shanghaiense TaxID=2201899 RepID=A0A316J8Z6_9HYPH|nr:6-phosphogluconolactonase [Falsochrobactrum shanghaiense]PWL18447.1 6-phosphogluconolactonase [Falsochrobactrum shanghaiense]